MNRNVTKFIRKRLTKQSHSQCKRTIFFIFRELYVTSWFSVNEIFLSNIWKWKLYFIPISKLPGTGGKVVLTKNKTVLSTSHRLKHLFCHLYTAFTIKQSRLQWQNICSIPAVSFFLKHGHSVCFKGADSDDTLALTHRSCAPPVVWSVVLFQWF